MHLLRLHPGSGFADIVFGSAGMSQSSSSHRGDVRVIGLVADIPTHATGGTGFMVTDSR